MGSAQGGLADGSWLRFAQLLDSALPIGAFSHSFGLETLVQDGVLRTGAELESYIRAMLEGNWATTDALAVKGVYVFGGQAGDWSSVYALDRELHLARAAAETRTGMAKIGRRLLQLVRELYPDEDWSPLVEGVSARKCPGAFPTVFGLAALRLGVELRTAGEGYLYACTVNAVNCALRLMAIGQTEGQRLIARLLPAVQEAWALAESLDPFDWYSSTPLAETAMMKHEKLYSRLFMS
ncbi:urease accessory protein UreF [Paenibacillus koleovorans]|uniref:urease accessory protein UreF n=1 Tax=Paenibacillus koleovorans TaxID=121608 RepID=UPI000FD7A865|nr:urease accessory protein UreF [Paenibacillus koleovorans]